MKFDGPRFTYDILPALNRMVQAQAAEAAGLVGHTEVDGGRVPISAAHERKLEGFARRLRLFGRQQGTTTIGTTSYEIKVDATGYQVVAVNGKRLDDAR